MDSYSQQQQHYDQLDPLQASLISAEFGLEFESLTTTDWEWTGQINYNEPEQQQQPGLESLLAQVYETDSEQQQQQQQTQLLSELLAELEPAPPPQLSAEPIDIEILSGNPETSGWFANQSGAGKTADDCQQWYKCRWIGCSMKFVAVDQLVAHIERLHVDRRSLNDEYTCFWNGCARKRRPFNARYKLLIHMRVHSGERPNPCPHPGCGKAFSRLENLKIHYRSHTGERPYACGYPACDRAFSNSSDRAKHQRTHADEKPYSCDIAGCRKRYTDPSSLRKHSRSHCGSAGDVTSTIGANSNPTTAAEVTAGLGNSACNHHQFLQPCFVTFCHTNDDTSDYF